MRMCRSLRSSTRVRCIDAGGGAVLMSSAARGAGLLSFVLGSERIDCRLARVVLSSATCRNS